MTDEKRRGIVTNLFVCPRCTESMSANEKPDKCAKCGFKFSKKGQSALAEKFEGGKSPYDQLYELVQQDMEKFMDQPANKFIPGMTKEKAEELRLSNKQRFDFFQKRRTAEMHQFFETMPFVEMESWLQSMLHFYQCLIRRGDKESIIIACNFGKHIGEISKNIEGLLKLGVQTYDGNNKTTTTGDSTPNQSNVGGEGDKSSA